MTAIFSWWSRDCSRAAGGRIDLGMDPPLLVKLSGKIKHLVMKFFLTQGHTRSEAKNMVESKEGWYGIVNGSYQNAAILLVIKSNKMWRRFKQFVAVCRSSFCSGFCSCNTNSLQVCRIRGKAPCSMLNLRFQAFQLILLWTNKDWKRREKLEK